MQLYFPLTAPLTAIEIQQALFHVLYETRLYKNTGHLILVGFKWKFKGTLSTIELAVINLQNTNES